MMIIEKPTANIVGIDPGSSALGFSAISVDPTTFDITNIFAVTYHGKHMLSNCLSECEYPSHTQPRHTRIHMHYQNLLMALSYHRPFAVSVESAFINAFRPAAYGALVEVTEAIRNAVRDYSSEVPLVPYEPSLIKKTVGSHAVGGKHDMLLALQSQGEISNKINLSLLDDHAVDAVAIALTHLTQIRKSI